VSQKRRGKSEAQKIIFHLSLINQVGEIEGGREAIAPINTVHQQITINCKLLIT
jgi:hypothetical protein